MDREFFKSKLENRKSNFLVPIKMIDFVREWRYTEFTIFVEEVNHGEECIYVHQVLRR